MNTLSDEEQLLFLENISFSTLKVAIYNVTLYNINNEFGQNKQVTITPSFINKNRSKFLSLLHSSEFDFIKEYQKKYGNDYITSDSVTTEISVHETVFNHYKPNQISNIFDMNIRRINEFLSLHFVCFYYSIVSEMTYVFNVMISVDLETLEIKNYHLGSLPKNKDVITQFVFDDIEMIKKLTKDFWHKVFIKYLSN